MNNLRIVDIKKSIKKTEILHGISLEINSGEIVGLLGPNGAGKTTTFYTVCGLVKPTSGKVFFDDEDITSIPLHKRALKGIGYLPQESSIFKDLSVEENLLLAAEIVIKDKEEQNRRVEELLELLDIEPIRQRKGISLSGGERRRTEIARALVSKPKFLLLDEPFAGVDPIAVEDIQNIVSKLKDKNIGILITDHNVHETLSITDRAYMLFEGKIMFQGTAEELAENPIVREKYLGSNFELRKKQ